MTEYTPDTFAECPRAKPHDDGVRAPRCSWPCCEDRPVVIEPNPSPARAARGHHLAFCATHASAR